MVQQDLEHQLDRLVLLDPLRLEVKNLKDLGHLLVLLHLVDLLHLLGR